MIIISILRVIKTAFQDFFRNIWLSLVTVMIIFLTLFSITVLLSLNVLSHDAMNKVEEKVDVSLVLKTTVTPEAVLALENKLKTRPEVKTVTFISKEEGLQKLVEKNPEIQKSLDVLDKNPLNDMIRVQAYDPKDYDIILSALDDPEFNKIIEKRDENFAESQTFINQLNNVAAKIKLIGYSIVVIFLFISIILVYSAITVSIYAHREEIAIMRLVGASNWFIRSPFVIMSLIYGVLATIITGVIIYPLLGLLTPYIVQFMGTADLNLVNYFNENFFYIFGIEMLVICVLNMISSSIAVGKYLRV